MKSADKESVNIHSGFASEQQHRWHPSPTCGNSAILYRPWFISTPKEPLSRKKKCVLVSSPSGFACEHLKGSVRLTDISCVVHSTSPHSLFSRLFDSLTALFSQAMTTISPQSIAVGVVTLAVSRPLFLPLSHCSFPLLFHCLPLQCMCRLQTHIC